MGGQKTHMRAPKVVDLFCGAGGFTLGSHQAGFTTAAAVDIDPTLSSPIARNLPKVPLHNLDLARLSTEDLSDLVGCQPDGVIGGPPCQGFSSIGKRDIDDPRNNLVGHFFRHVSGLQPKFFLMENVRGIMFDRVRHILESALAEVTDDYNVIGPFVIDASRHGAPTKRMRVLVVGIRKDIATTLTAQDFQGSVAASPKVKDAIGDLSGATYIGRDELGFDLWRYPRLRPSNYAARARQAPDGSKIMVFTGHEKVCHTANVQKRFAAVPQGATDPIGKHVRLSWQGFAPTLRAGTGSDKGSYQSVRPLHPDEPRVITVREAARLQGFPDWYRLHPTTWHSFRMIGNSVPPPVAASVLQVLHNAVRAPARPMIAAE